MDFTILNRTVIFEGKVFDVHKVLARLPDGRHHEYDLVKHGGAVTLVPVDPSGNLLFVRQFRLGAMQELLELPAGTLEGDEAPELAASRELREETGMAAAELRELGQFFMAAGYSSEYLHIYLATGLYPSPLAQDADEFLQLVAIPVKQVYEMVHTNQVHDGKTLAALLLAHPFLT